MEPHKVKRKLAAILSTDVKGYSRLMGDDELATIRTLTLYREAMISLIEQYQGRVVDSPGDNLLAEFASAVDAVQCAIAIQKEFKARNAELSPQRRMEFRIGINVGDVVVAGERIYGDGVNIAARLEGLAEGGGICISGTVYDHVEGKLTVECAFLGAQTVKNIAKPVRVYRVEIEPRAVALQIGPEQVDTLPFRQRRTVLPNTSSIAVLPPLNFAGASIQAIKSTQAQVRVPCLLQRATWKPLTAVLQLRQLLRLISLALRYRFSRVPVFLGPRTRLKRQAFPSPHSWYSLCHRPRQQPI
jgi:class 3 adenylate cyclase